MDHDAAYRQILADLRKALVAMPHDGSLDRAVGQMEEVVEASESGYIGAVTEAIVDGGAHAVKVWERMK